MAEWTMSCRCGEVELQASGKPIVSSACYCSDCREAGHQLERLSKAPELVGADGGTPAVLFRKDRVVATGGENLLREYRLAASSPTRRVITSCCNTPMFLDFTQGFWLSVYSDCIVGDVPPIQMRTMTKERPEGVELHGDVPNVQGHSGIFMLKLMLAWAAMGFRRAPWRSYPSLETPAP